MGTDKWNLFEESHFEGQKVLVQLIAVRNQVFLVAMYDGNFGVLHFKEVDWTK